jgi:hypothetical protein
MDMVLVFGGCPRPAMSDLSPALRTPAPAPAAVLAAVGLVLLDAMLGVVFIAVLALLCLAEPALATFWCTR